MKVEMFDKNQQKIITEICEEIINFPNHFELLFGKGLGDLFSDSIYPKAKFDLVRVVIQNKGDE
jgi:hypothetical protein